MICYTVCILYAILHAICYYVYYILYAILQGGLDEDTAMAQAIASSRRDTTNNSTSGPVSMDSSARRSSTSGMYCKQTLTAHFYVLIGNAAWQQLCACTALQRAAFLVS